jgi:hypothetical protein
METNNMKKIITCLTVGLLVVGAQSLMAQSTTNSVNQPGAHTPGEHRDHMAILKLVGLTPADVKGLSREARQAKIKQAATALVAQLQGEKAAGTLTAEQQIRLNRLEKFLAHANHPNAGTPPGN